MTTLSTKEVAEKLNTTPRTLRKFIRSEVKEAGGTIGEDTPGKGRRYAFESKEIASMRKRFKAWNKKQAELRAARAAKAAEEAAEEAADEAVEDEVNEDDATDEVADAE